MKSSLRDKSARPESLLTFRLRPTAVIALLATLVLFSIVINYRPPQVAAQEQKPFNLTSISPDVNGFEFNPRWAWQVANPGAVPDPNKLCFDSDGKYVSCTTDAVDFDEPEDYKILRQTCRVGAGTEVKGHINWRAAAYRTRLSWGEFSIDGDYCFELKPVDENWSSINNNGLTTNRPTLHMEFHAGEMIKHFNTSWWKDFRKSVGIRQIQTSTERDFATRFLTGKRAMVIGLVNLDCVHNCYTELHPIYAVAINIETRKPNADGSVDEVWAIFARNWGNEGWCSRDQHYLNLETHSNKLLLTIPWGPDTPAGNSALAWDVVGDGTTFLTNNNQASGPEVSAVGSGGILLSFVLPKADDRARIHGELRLRWKMPPTTVPAAPSVSAMANPAMSATSTAPQEEEDRELSKAMGEEGRKRVEKESKADKPDGIRLRVKVKGENAKGISQLLGPLSEILQSPPSQAPRVESKYDAEKAARDRRLLGVPPNAP